ncbi:helix-turn-helix domain-containing protein [Kitasatospora griseola]|uniref:helix-turn-helix domain-containing protein n=1 Tax=Kitasatospora griseola TaxID=2064 RepID=UPI000696918D|nr:XRE family transcriptional regulator [Kitasatospora griseola]
MPNEDEAIRHRVRTLIESNDVNQQELAQTIGTTPSKLSKSLNGTRRFSTYELAAIARHFHTTVDFLVDGKMPAKGALAARDDSHRSEGWKRAAARAEELDEIEAAMNDLGVAPHADFVWKRPALSGLAIADGPDLAAAARRILDEHGFEADMASSIENAFNIHVVAERFGAGFDGLSWHTDDSRIIIINIDAVWSRQRFTIAHELGHHLAGDVDDAGLVTDLDVMARASGPMRIAEMRANAFAAALLMPADDVAAKCPDGTVSASQFASMVGEFRVSSDALAWRLKSLGLISDEQRLGFSQMRPEDAASDGGWIELYQDLFKHQARERVPEAITVRALNAFLRREVSARWAAKAIGCEADVVHQAFDGYSVEPADDKDPVFAP